ncbi:TPA: aminotransferase class III-fold pyridoxal phosphate-dependent enzyme [Staphylococcus aureus]|uniref:aminotransferase class III-fold pyridoxal phosphate-dependent enzyme n=1 Tax=Staphylococcus aureus TaxID=1280 RepID=UPI000B2DD65B|nr:aminotransferase class III-fold pyridoxal phosphate-dependent enzyme [Staphylococcus aureus]MBS3285567.1 aminotransferase class III-fold pyridoxal phosphate-dependent enzyme [Staphylococcus aureus]MBS3293538.1 aminotransferase class III-fold pyridoxal phosphate-dependent enzyme [Staphylococcus aureus]MBS3304199.1 aminotransferase class III-fold pyridoxal phosphate-dependent enzyme [Staphylococcus aureus]MBS3339137.1 aminotransferase class III-fold pyridoxal phosphate-dependent enzyme [Staphy
MSNKYGFLNGFLRNDTLHDIELYSGSGDKLIDKNNKKYVDLNSGLWNVSLGYNHELNENIKKSFSDILDNNLPYIDMTSYSHKLYDEVSQKLIDFMKTPDLNKVIFTNSGSESIEAALKIMHTIGNKNYIASFSNSYHGTFYGDMSISGLTKPLNTKKNVDYKNTILFDFPENHSDEIELFKNIEKYSEKINALFIEPVIGSGGIYFRSTEFYNKLIKLCNDLDIFVVFDEVATGFYKTGNRFFINKLDVAPDIICLSKAINNGTLPAGALILKESLSNSLENTTIKHMSTQNGNLLVMSSIYETLNYYIKYDNSLLNNVNLIMQKTKEICLENNVNGRIIGSMIAIPVNKKDIEPLVKLLKMSGIIVYRHITKNGSGLTLYPNINIDIKVYEKTLKYIMKKVNKYEYS